MHFSLTQKIFTIDCRLEANYIRQLCKLFKLQHSHVHNVFISMNASPNGFLERFGILGEKMALSNKRNKNNINLIKISLIIKNY